MRNRTPRGRLPIRDVGAVAAAFFADDKQQGDARFTGGAQPTGRRHLRGKDAFGVARTASEHQAAFYSARKERRHAVEVGRKDDRRRRAEMGVDVEAAVGDRLLDDLVLEITQATGQPVAGLPFTSGGGIDVDETACQLDRINRCRHLMVRIG
jgi:hypothetical protein